MKLFTILPLVVCGCSMVKSTGKPPSMPSGAISSEKAETVNQAALLAIQAKLEAEINALKIQSGRDSYTGMTFNGEMSVMLAVLLAIVVLSQTWEQTLDRWCEYRETMGKRP